jgi:thiamine pyrophosphokinase
MKIGIVAGGPEHLIPELAAFNKASEWCWIGVDRGAFVLLEQGLKPAYAFGDFDSVSNAERDQVLTAGIPLNIYQSEKDQTDMEIAFQWALDQDPQEILLFGATGGRLDHEVLNLQLLFNGISSRAAIKLVDRNNEVTLSLPGTYTVTKEETFSYVSFIAFSEVVSGITLSGFKYPLKDASLKKGSSRCISNELVKKIGTYSFDSGIIMMVKSRD